MPPGLVEGAETIVWFTLLLAVPSLAPGWMGTMAAATFIGAALRVRAGIALLGRLDSESLSDTNAPADIMGAAAAPDGAQRPVRRP